MVIFGIEQSRQSQDHVCLYSFHVSCLSLVITDLSIEVFPDYKVVHLHGHTVTSPHMHFKLQMCENRREERVPFVLGACPCPLQ